MEDKDYGDLAAKIKLIAIDEMRHAEMLAERIKELDGEPVAIYSGNVEKAQEVEHVFEFDKNLEDNTMDVYSQLLLLCRENGDNISRKLFETLIDEKQIHFNYFDDVNDHIEKLGNTYLAQIAGTPSSTGPSTKGFAIGEEAAG